MKKTIFTFASLMLLFLGVSCTDFLEEENHSKMTPESFSTSQGFELGLNAVYGGMRRFYGGDGGSVHHMTVSGTDEFVSRNSDDQAKLGNYTAQYRPDVGSIWTFWSNSYAFINTCNGLVHFGEQITDIPESQKARMLAEARFFRAFLYFRLVQLFGDVTLNKTYISTVEKSAKRNPSGDVYAFIVEDLLYCVAPGNLPEGPKDTDPGKVTRALARHLLAKVYLTRGWSKDAVSEDFQNAYDMAKGLIDDQGTTGVKLTARYADVHKPGNEDGEEVLYNVQMTADPIYGVPESENGMNRLPHFFTSGYQQFNFSNNIQTIEDGRVWARYHGTTWLYNEVFLDHEKDTRYYGTFQTVWRVPQGGAYTNKESTFWVGDTQYKRTVSAPTVGETAAYLPGRNMTKEEIESYPYHVVTPENYTDPWFPTMNKYNDPNRTSFSFDSRRSIIVYRLAETYLIAAEAAMKLNNYSETNGAAYYVNELRRRAAANPEVVGDLLATAAEAQAGGVDFILDERTRELCGEQLRWFDLVRTQSLVRRVQAHGWFQTKWFNERRPQNNIRDYHVLRPIPLRQIQSVIEGEPYTQNPGWEAL